MKPLDDSVLHAALERYHFNEETGSFFVIVRNVNNEPVITGKFAGTTTPAGIRLTVGFRHVMAHHLAWRIYYGEWPIANVKHKNGDVMDCKASNLYSPAETEKRKTVKNEELTQRVDFLKSIGITQESMQRALLDRVRSEKGEVAYIEHMHALKRITEDQRTEMLYELKRNSKGLS